MKAHILSILKKADKPVSGEAMGALLGVSRVAVFKQIDRLRKLGYAITATGSGYRLDREPDALFPWAFPGREDRIHYFPETGSTMETARRLAREGCPPFTVVAADVQTLGRGRLDRTWDSGKGGLYFTVVTRPRLTPDAGHQILFAASWIIAVLLAEMYRIDARLKWPNDVLVKGKKIAGMLSEMEAEVDRVRYANIGIGINMNNDVSRLDVPAASVKALVGKPVLRRDFLERFMEAFEPCLDNWDFRMILDRWKDRSETLSRPVRIVTLRETIEGIAEDLDDDGALRLRQKNGETRRIVYGDCFHA